jgi:outer membrane immunogenic protein
VYFLPRTGWDLMLMRAFISYGNPAAASASGSPGLGQDGRFIGGAQFGYHGQFNSFVTGLETDIQGVVGRGGSVNGAVSFGPVSPATGTADVTTFTASKHLDYLGTVRSRFGFLVSPT